MSQEGTGNKVLQFLRYRWDHLGYTKPIVANDVIRSKLLFCLNILLYLSVIIYIVVSFIISKLYLEFEEPKGFVRYRFEVPEFVNQNKYSYCSPSFLSSWNGTTATDCSTLSIYEIRSTNDERTSALFIPTRVAYFNLTRVCGLFDRVCPYKRSMSAVKRDSFIAGVEELEIWIDHVIRAPRFYEQTYNKQYEATTTEMRGKLVSANPVTGQDELIKYFDIVNPIDLKAQNNSEQEINRVKRNKFHIMTFGDMLRAARIPTLDVPSELPDSGGGSLRMDGGFFMMTIVYSDTNYTLSPTGIIDFTMRVTRVLQTEAKVYLDNWNFPNFNQQQSYAGILVRFYQLGALSRTNWQVILFQIVGAFVYYRVGANILDYLSLCMITINPGLVGTKKKPAVAEKKQELQPVNDNSINTQF